jgi:superfamily II DNA helicase RecQ
MIGLECDKVANGSLINQQVKSYHLDEPQGNDHILLLDHLIPITDKRAQSIVLFTSPQSLQKASIWFPLFKVLSNKKVFLLSVIDEAHIIHLQGLSFQPEFQIGITNFSQFKNLFTYIPLLVISATLRSINQGGITCLTGVPPTHLC